MERLVDSFIETGLFGGTAIIAGSAKKDMVVFSRGLADPIAKSPWTHDTVIDVSSVSKPMGAAMAAAICVERGLIDPDKCFSEYLPRYAGKMVAPVNIRHLAYHYSGIKPNYPLVDDPALMMKKMLASDFPVPPMTSFRYSCVNFHYIGMIVENVTGARLDDFAYQNIFAPLGMKDTWWGRPAGGARERLARTGRDMDREPGHIFDCWAAVLYPHVCGNAGIFTTANDVAKFARMMIARCKGLLKSEGMIHELFDNACPGGADLVPRSFGWSKEKRLIPAGMSESETIFHTGSSGQTVWIDPKSDRFIVILTNLFGSHDEGIQARYRIACEVVRKIM